MITTVPFVLALALASCLFATSHAHAQAPVEPVASAPDYSGVRYGSMIKLRCPDGEYQGLEPGKKIWQKDDYTWAVSREFAQRFCMPEALVDETLKGAEAVAFRVRPSDTQTCRIEAGQEVCRRQAEFQLELYLRSDLNLPRSFPEVQFFVREVESSGMLIQTNQSLKNSDRRRAGVFRDPLGRRPPYHVASSPDEKRRVKFMYLNFGPEQLAHPGSDLVETYFQSQWVDGVDLIRLNGGSSTGLGILSHPGAKHLPGGFGIGVIRDTDIPGNRDGLLRMTRDRYRHVIDLPRRISDLIYAYDMQQGDLLINAANQILAVLAKPPSAGDAEPLVPPAAR